MGIPSLVQDGTIPDLSRCAPPLSPLARRELRLAAVVAASKAQTIDEVAPLLGVTKETARTYLKFLAPKLPGDIASDLARVKVWARGASLHVLGAE